MEASSNLKSPCKTLSKKQEDGRWLELAGQKAMDLLKIDFPDFSIEGNDLSDEEYASSQGGPADHWNPDMAIEDKNIWSSGGKTRRTTQWGKKVAKRMYPHRERQKDRSKPIIPRQKILHVSLRAALTNEAEAELMNQNVTVQEVGFVVTEENVDEAAFIRYLLLLPIVSAALYHHLLMLDEPYFDVEDALLKDGQHVYDEPLVLSPTDFDFLPDDSMPGEPDEELFDKRGIPVNS